MRVPDLVDSGLFQGLVRPLPMDVDRRGVAWVRPLFRTQLQNRVWEESCSTVACSMFGVGHGEHCLPFGCR